MNTWWDCVTEDVKYYSFIQQDMHRFRRSEGKLTGRTANTGLPGNGRQNGMCTCVFMHVGSMLTIIKFLR